MPLSPSPPDAMTTETDRTRALLVEDDPIIALDFEDTILGLGVTQVRTAGNVAKALNMIADREPDFALLDVSLIREKSFAVAERLAALGGLPVVGVADRFGRRRMLLITVGAGLALTALAALGREGELAMHVRAALRNGLSPEQIGEVLLQVGIYAGVPAANSAFAVAQQVLAELGAEDGPAPV